MYIKFFICTFLQGTTRKSDDIRGSPFLKFTRKKVFILMQNAFYVFRSRTPVSKVKGDDLCHYASMTVMPPWSPSSFNVYSPVENIYVLIHIYMHICTYSLLLVHMHAYRIIHTYTYIYIHILKLTWARIYIHTYIYVYILILYVLIYAYNTGIYWHQRIAVRRCFRGGAADALGRLDGLQPTRSAVTGHGTGL
jgi:hypothetical protein